VAMVRNIGRVTMSDPVFVLEGVHYNYPGGIKALDGLNLSVNAGDRIAILGANGSGKSTLLRLLDALYFPSQGKFTAFGKLITEESFQDEDFAFSFRRRVALVFQDPDVQLFNATVFDEVAFGPLQLGWDKSEIIRKVNDILDLMEIAHLRDRAPHRLSGGEQKRVALASVLILDPEVLLLDEPTAALDPRSQEQIIDFLTLWGQKGKTIICSTHDLDIVEDIADKCYVIQAGKVAANGSPGDILADINLLLNTNLIRTPRIRLNSP